MLFGTCGRPSRRRPSTSTTTPPPTAPSRWPREAGAIVRHEPRKGKGNVIRRAFADVDADAVLLIDGDDTYDATRAREMVDLLFEGPYDQVLGTREEVTTEAYRPGHAIGNRLLTGAVATLFGRQVTDMLSGYRVFSRRFIKSFPALSHEFETETEMTVHALHLRLPTRRAQDRLQGPPRWQREQAAHLSGRVADPQAHPHPGAARAPRALPRRHRGHPGPLGARPRHTGHPRVPADRSGRAVPHSHPCLGDHGDRSTRAHGRVRARGDGPPAAGERETGLPALPGLRRLCPATGRVSALRVGAFHADTPRRSGDVLATTGPGP